MYVSSSSDDDGLIEYTPKLICTKGKGKEKGPTIIKGRVDSIEHHFQYWKTPIKIHQVAFNKRIQLV